MPHNDNVNEVCLKSLQICTKKRDKKINNHMYISIHSLFSILYWSTSKNNYCLTSFSMMLQLGSFIFGRFLPFSFARSLKLHQVGWGASVRRFSDLSRVVQSGSSLGHSETFTELSRSHSFVILAVCLGFWSCWKVNLLPSLRFWIINAISIFWCTELFSTLTSPSFPVYQTRQSCLM